MSIEETKICQERNHQTEVGRKIESVIFGKFVFKQSTLFGDSAKYKILFISEKDSPVTLNLDVMIDKIQPYLPFNTLSYLSEGHLKHFDRSFQVGKHVVEVTTSGWMQNVKIKSNMLIFSKVFDRAIEPYGHLYFEK